MLKLFLAATFFITSIKFLFLPSYVSTDFEVHRNWLAITNSLSIDKWYFDNTSQWTLDYPPFFAWFEYTLSLVANHFDRNMTKVDNLNYISPETRFFQKLTVIISDFVFIYAIFKIIRCKPTSKRLNDSLLVLLLCLRMLAPFGLVLIDHIHFQYNGLLFGILLLSIFNMMNQRYYWASFWFAVLLNCKHIFVYYAPAYAVYLFCHFCFKEDKEREIRFFDWRRFLTLGAIVAGVFTLSFGPFVAMNQFGQVLRRLFPFNERGLTHSYWAPNFWSLYNFVDVVANRMVGVNGVAIHGMTQGLVEKYSHSVLANITPLHTIVLTLISVTPAMIKCRSSKSLCDFVKLLTICAWCAFMFGWHVHEKAVLMITIPLMIIELFDGKCQGFSFYVATVGHFSLLPLIPTDPEYSLKMVLFLACTCTHYVQLVYLQSNLWQSIHPLFRLHIVALIPLCVVTDFVLPIFVPQFPFLPLILISVSSAMGLLLAYIQFYLYYLTGNEKWCWNKSVEPVSAVKKNE